MIDMKHKRNSIAFALILAGAVQAWFAAPILAEPTGAKLELRPGDRIVFIGNTFAERMRQFGYFETLLNARFAGLELSGRNMGWSADELSLRPRPLNFGNVHVHLEKQSADVIFLCFGFNESFKGEEGLEPFKKNLAGFIDALRDHKYNGKTRPRLVVVSPIPHEKFELLPDPRERNSMLALYTRAMGEVAERKGMPFADIFSPMREWAESPDAERLTFNSIHLTRRGYWVASQILMDALGFTPEAVAIEIDAASGRVRSRGIDVSDVKLGRDLLGFTVQEHALPRPPPPKGETPPTELARRVARLKVTNLPPGRYTLRIGDHTIATAPESDWSRGVEIENTPARAFSEALRKKIVAKNRLFYDRWRAINGFYIYGGRKEPFGVVSFPAEMERYDELVIEHDIEIMRMSKPLGAQLFELVRVGP